MLTFDDNILDPDFRERVGSLRETIKANKRHLDSLEESYDTIFESMNTYNKTKDNGN